MGPRNACVALIALAAVGGARPAAAGGFYVPEIGSRATALGGAVVGRRLDTTSVFHNPAGLAGQEGTQVQLGGVGVFPNIRFYRRPVAVEGGPTVTFDPVRNTNRFGAIPYLGVASDLGIKDFSAALGVFVPYGAHIEYPVDGAQRHVITDVSLRAIHVAPTIAYRFAKRFSVGAGLNYIHADLSLGMVNALQFVTGDPEEYPDPDPASEGTTSLEGRDPASFGANVGVLYTDPAGRFGIGASVMTPVRLAFKGRAVVENPSITPLIGADGQELQPGGRRTDDFELGYPLPLIARIGTMVRPTEALSLSLDVNWQRWSTFDSLKVEFEENHELLPTPGAFMADTVLDNHWTDTISVRLGGEAEPLRGRGVPLYLRGGALYDQSPIADEYFDVLAPDSDKLGVAGGLGYKATIGQRVSVEVNVSYLHLFIKERAVGPVGVGPETLGGNDEDASATNDSVGNAQHVIVPGSNKTILNKPAPSFFYGVTRAGFDLLALDLTIRL